MIYSLSEVYMEQEWTEQEWMGEEYIFYSSKKCS